MRPGSFVRHACRVFTVGGASPLRAVMSETVRLSKGVGREAKSEGSDGGTASTTGVQTRRTETGYKAGMRWVIGQWTETPPERLTLATPRRGARMERA